MTIPSPIATAADYADALLTARRFKNALFWLLLVMLLTQLGLFLLAKYTTLVLPPLPPAASDASTQPVIARTLLSLFLQYVTGVIDFLGLLASIVLSVTLLLMLNILIMGRLLGVSQLTGAYLASVVLAVLLFPWQAFLNFSDLHEATFRLPGVLYTWAELARDARFEHLSAPAAILKWGRFVGFPLAATLLLLTIQSQSRRALRRALGEVDTPASPAPTP
jgi:hypothetical protein